MKLLHVDQREGVVRVRVDTLDDLWTLRNLIQPGDLVTASTHRTAEVATDNLRAGKAEKRPMTLGIRVEQVDWHDFDDHLRVLGVIEEGPQDHGRHHTLVLRDEPGAPVTICKRGGLGGWHLEQVRAAEAATKRPQVVLLAIDDAEAQFAILRGYGIQWLGSLPAGGQGKRFEGAAEAKRRFYDEATKTLKGLRTDATVPAIVVGPGWWREEFLAHVGDKDPQLAAGILTDGTSQGGRAGIHEALRRGQVERVARDHRIHEETALMESLFARLAQPESLVAVGPDECRAAVAAGAAELVLVSDERVRHGDVDDVLAEAERTRCRIHIVASGHEAGARLAQLAGVAALLRYAV